MEKIIRLLRDTAIYRSPDTYQGELDNQCGLGIIPMSIVSAFIWLPFIPLDRALHPEVPSVVYFRLGLSFMGILTLVLFLIPFPRRPNSYFTKNKCYLLLYSIVGYLMLSTGIILGLVAADPAYMGGYAIIVIILSFMPFRVKHSIILLCLSIVVFIPTGIYSGMTFESSREKYGLFNLIGSSIISILVILILHTIRKNSYFKSLVIQRESDSKVRLFFLKRGISSREEEIVNLILLGKSNKEIENKLFISSNTVKNHIYHIYQKLNVNSRLQLVNLVENIKKK
jgi:DNA-binding CsgD family transcriptional regulator